MQTVLNIPLSLLSCIWVQVQEGTWLIGSSLLKQGQVETLHVHDVTMLP